MKLGHSNIREFDDTLRKKMPWTTAAFAAGALAMVGIPPTVGFFSKWYLALGTIENKSWHFLVIILLSSLLNAVYFFRIIEKIYFKSQNGSQLNEEKQPIKRSEVTISMLVPTLVLAVALFIFGLLNTLIVKGVLMKVLPPGM
jgi:multicomponent Na+:H+ antiporter subunit D